MLSLGVSAALREEVGDHFGHCQTALDEKSRNPGRWHASEGYMMQGENTGQPCNFILATYHGQSIASLVEEVNKISLR